MIEILKKLRTRRRERRAEELPDDYIDLLLLSANGLVTVSAIGEAITSITAKVTSRVARSLRVVIVPGTCFVSSGNHQNMAARRSCRFELGPSTTERVFVPATCINAKLAIPSNTDRFSGVRRPSASLQKFFEAAQNEDAMVIQAGAWAITDGYTKAQVQAHLRSRHVSTVYGIPIPGMQGSDRGPAISDADIARARAILNQLGIRSRL
jgi:hypothetical protein